MVKKSSNEKNREKFYKGYKVMTDNHIGAFGETDTKKKVVKINLKKNRKSKRKGELSDTIAHEFIHVRHPRLSEKQTYKRTAKISQKEKSKLLKYIKK
jgi:hypothetical protein